MSNSALAVTAITWIPRGSARQKPVRFELTSEDVSKLTAKAYVSTMQHHDAMHVEPCRDVWLVC